MLMSTRKKARIMDGLPLEICTLVSYRIIVKRQILGVHHVLMQWFFVTCKAESLKYFRRLVSLDGP